MFKLTNLASIVALTCMSAMPVFGGVSAEQADQLGKNLTPIGAEMAGNSDGSIPKWTGGLPKNAGAINNGFRANPFAAEKPLFVIDGQNYSQYQQKLTPGQVAMFKRYPQTYKMPVYVTHRSAGLSDRLAQDIKQNALKASLIEGGMG